MSPELYLLIQSVKSIILQKQENSMIPSKDFDWNEVLRKTTFHSIRPIVFQFLKQNGISEKREELSKFATEQTFLNLQYMAEIRRLLVLFKEKGVRVLPYKGVLFVNELYGNNQLREVGDIDLLFTPESATKGMQLLFEEGYKMNNLTKIVDNLPQSELISKCLSANGQYEASFKKDNVAIDFHWGLHYGYLPYKIDFEALFKTAVEKDFFGVKCEVPSSESIFWMLLLHHGGKEQWVRLKHFADLGSFMKMYGERMDWKTIFETAHEYKLQRQMLTGFFYLKTYFDFQLPTFLDQKLGSFLPNNQDKTIAYWDKSQHWSSLWPRLKYEKLLIGNQDEGFSKLGYLKSFYASNTNPNPLEDSRIFNFSDKYPSLNFISKVLTYLIRKFS